MLVGEVGQSEAQNHGIERSRLHLEILAVRHSGRHVRQSGRRRLSLRIFEDRKGDVDGENGPTRPDPLGRATVCPPAPAATSMTRAPSLTPAMSSIAWVAWPSQASSVGPHRCQASAAVCHCSRVVLLYATGSKTRTSDVDIDSDLLPRGGDATPASIRSRQQNRLVWVPARSRPGRALPPGRRGISHLDLRAG